MTEWPIWSGQVLQGEPWSGRQPSATTSLEPRDNVNASTESPSIDSNLQRAARMVSFSRGGLAASGGGRGLRFE